MKLNLRDKPINPLNPAAAAGDFTPFTNPGGLWSIAVPASFVKGEPAPGNLIQSFHHPSGATVTIGVVQQVPFKSGEDFYKQAIRVGLAKGGAKFDQENPTTLGGVDGFVGRFSRSRNSVDEIGQSFVAVNNGIGFIVEMLMPAA